MKGLNFKNSISRKLKFEKLKRDIIEKLGEIPDLQNLKLDIEVSLFVCRCIETEVVKSDRIVKKDLFIEILQHVFNLTRDEVVAVEKQLEFLHENNKITKSKIVNYVYNSVKDWLNRKIL